MKLTKREKIIASIKIFIGFFIGFIFSALSQVYWHYWDEQPKAIPYVALLQVVAGVPMAYADYVIYKLIPRKYLLFGKIPLCYIPLLHIAFLVLSVFSTLLYPILNASR